MMGAAVAVGIDVAAMTLHVIGLDESRRVVLAQMVAPTDLLAVLSTVDAGACVAIDAPDEQRHPMHLSDETLSQKFRTGRCAEIALARRGYWVPWVTPAIGAPASAWMKTGFQLWRDVRALGLRSIEVYPHSAFKVLGGRKSLSKKGTLAGTTCRVELLAKAGLRANDLIMWSHDSLDAAVAAIVAHDALANIGEEVRCDDDNFQHDGSAMWLPAPLRLP